MGFGRMTAFSAVTALVGASGLYALAPAAAGQERQVIVRSPRVVVQSEDGGHRASADRHRVLHGLRAQADQRQRIAQRNDAGHHQRRVFAQAMTRDNRRRRTARLAPRAIHGVTRGQHERLGIDG